MHEEFCSQGDRWETYGPCFQFRLKDKGLGKADWDKEMEAVRRGADGPRTPPRSPAHAYLTRDSARRAQLRERVPVEKGQEQMDEMHDFWCERPEFKAAEEGSALHDLCDNYFKHKESRKTEL